MAYIELKDKYKELAEKSYDLEKTVLQFIDQIIACPELGSENTSDKKLKIISDWQLHHKSEGMRWASIAKTDLEKAFMGLRKSITYFQKSKESQ